MIPAWAEQYLGIPYKLGGRDRSGLDCWGLVRLVSKEQFNQDLPSLDFELTSTEIAELEFAMKAGREISKVNPVQKGIGKIVLFNIAGKPSHVGLMISESYFIHIGKSIEVTISTISLAPWSNRVEGFYGL